MRGGFYSLKKTKAFCKAIFLNFVTQENAEKQQLKSWHYQVINF